MGLAKLNSKLYFYVFATNKQNIKKEVEVKVPPIVISKPRNTQGNIGQGLTQ